MRYLILTLTLAILCACTNIQPTEPDRPANLPETAVWYGGLDGGDWRDCKKTGTQIDCSVYTGPIDGNLAYTQSFKLCGSDNPSEWMGFVGGITYDVGVRNGGLYWSPISPAVIFENGKIDVEMTAKSERIFNEEYQGPCFNSLLSE